MFGVAKFRLIEAVKSLQRNQCSYDSKKGEPPSRCDCKYGFHLESKKSWGSESNGCPELRLVGAILSVMTDEEYQEFAKRAGAIIG